VHLGPQAHFSPQGHPERRSFRAVWQPQVQVAPAHESHVQAFGVVMFVITAPLKVVDVLSTRSSVAPVARRGIEQTRCCSCMNWLFLRLRHRVVLNGEAISKKSPRIITDGGIPNI